MTTIEIILIIALISDLMYKTYRVYLERKKVKNIEKR